MSEEFHGAAFVIQPFGLPSSFVIRASALQGRRDLAFNLLETAI
jgi:hypothetical protein